jgi:tetrahedral aminopeptidase
LHEGALIFLKEKELISVLFKLSRAAGVAGYEDSVIKIASRYFEKYGCAVERDRFGNLLALKPGSSQNDEKRITLALVAHIDEIGALVTKIEAGGFLRFTPIGGLDARTLPGQAVVVHGRKKLKGVIGAAPPHLLSAKDKKETVPSEKLFIDVGLDFESANSLVVLGDTISLDQKPLLLKSKTRVTGKALDDRAGVAALIYCAAELADQKHRADICFVASLQEEVGLRGAITAAYGLKPDLAVALDVTHGDGPGLERNFVYKLNSGPALAIGPNFHVDFSRKIQAIAKDNFLPFQIEPIPGRSGTDAWAFQVSREGIPTALISIPLRYMHTAVELLSVEDLLATGKMLSYIARDADSIFDGDERW